MKRDRSRELHDQTLMLLLSLGRDVESVAATLDAAGVRGVPADPRDCAIACYLSAVMGSDPRIRRVKVGKGEAAILRGWRRRPVVVELPRPLRDFIAAFDARRVPRLIRDEPSVSLHTGTVTGS